MKWILGWGTGALTKGHVRALKCLRMESVQKLHGFLIFLRANELLNHVR